MCRLLHIFNCFRAVIIGKASLLGRRVATLGVVALYFKY